MCVRCKKKLIGKQTRFCSDNCRNAEGVTRRRRKLKQLAVEYKGKKCSNCSYSKCIAALQFHHPNGDKEFGIAAEGVTRSWEKVKAELDKCILLCANCHAERHSGVV